MAISTAVDLILSNGRIATMERPGELVEALAVSGHRIVALGPSDEIATLADPDTLVLDCDGRTVLPGFIDSHCHPDMYAARVGRWTDLAWPKVWSKDEVLGRIQSALRGKPRGAWFTGFRFDDVKLGGYPSLAELDRAGAGHPVFVFRTDGHLGVANSEALARCGFGPESPDPPFGRLDRDPATGKLTGLLREAAVHRMVDLIQALGDRGDTVEHIAQGLRTVFDEYLRYGITSVHNSLTTSDGIAAYQQLHAAGELKMRVGIIASGREEGLVESLIRSGMRSGFGDDWIRLLGVEWCPDCSTSGRTAAYYEPYVGQAILGEPADNRGMLLYDQDDFNARVLAAHRAGLMVCADGVGDRGIDFVLDGFEAALAAVPRADHRMRVEHCCYVTPRIRDRLKRLDVIASSATAFAYDLGDAYLSNRGRQAMDRMWPHHSLNDAGIVAPGHSDSPICHADPLRAIQAMVTRRSDSGACLGPGEAVSLWEALRAYTWLGAYAGREEGLKGSLAVGKLADLCLLDRDLFAAPPEEIAQAKVTTTILGGKIVHGEGCPK